MIDTSKIEVTNMDIATENYPDFTDSFISEAIWIETGIELTEEELDQLNNDAGYVYSQIEKWVY
jgi:hypothetical protein